MYSLRGFSSLELQILGIFLNSIKKNSKYFYDPFFYEMFINILTIQKKIENRKNLKIDKVTGW